MNTVSPYLLKPLRSLKEAKGERPLPFPTLYINDSAIYEPPPIVRRRSHKRAYITIILTLSLLAGAFLAGPLLQWLAGL